MRDSAKDAGRVADLIGLRGNIGFDSWQKFPCRLAGRRVQDVLDEAPRLAAPQALARIHLLGHPRIPGGPDISRRIALAQHPVRSEEHTSELQSLMRISYAVFCLKKK